MFHGKVGSTGTAGWGSRGDPAVPQGQGVYEGTLVERKAMFLPVAKRLTGLMDLARERGSSSLTVTCPNMPSYRLRVGMFGKVTARQLSNLKKKGVEGK